MISESSVRLSFSGACAKAETFDTAEKDALLPMGRTRLFVHDRPTERVAVLLHGITNNPQQWEVFGQSLHADGWNVLIPRLPFHGYKDLMTDLPGKLDAPLMRRYTADAVVTGKGLGEKVAVVGLSAGGVYAAWAAQEHSIDRAIVIAPLFGLPHIPFPLMPLVTGIFRLLPNQMWWWNRKEKGKHIPPHAYPRFSTHNLAETLHLGEQVFQAARKRPPLCPNIRIVSNAADRSVNNAATEAVVAAWVAQGASVRTHLFPATDALPHDVIDLTQPTGKTPLVYATLRTMLEGI